MMKRKTNLIKKHPTKKKKKKKKNIPSNYGPTTCLPKMRKILTAQIKEEIYYLQTDFKRTKMLLQGKKRKSLPTIYEPTHP